MSALLLWCPILFSEANILHPHSADRVRIWENEGVNICQTLKMTRALEKNLYINIYLWKKPNKQPNKQKERKKDKEFKTAFLV